MTVIERALQWALDIAADQSHGYSQQNRWGPDYDCSSLVLQAYRQAGADIGGATYTGNMYLLKQLGFTDVTKQINLTTGAGLQRGDILYYHKSGNIGHTAMYAGNGRIVHARGQSYGSGRTGDQGSEIAVTAYYRGSWTTVLRYTGKEPAAVQQEKKTAGWIDPKTYYTITAKMPLIKYGCVGSSVSIWQQLIGVDVDGEFGISTQMATLGFQNNHDLETDGKVGPKTWGAALSELT